MRRFVPALAAFVVLAACGTQESAEDVSDQLEEAAEQSDPAAAQVLENAADRIEEMEGVAPAGAPGSVAQDAMQRAGEAQLGNMAVGQQPTPEPLQAKPHRAGDPVPPPKIKDDAQ